MRFVIIGGDAAGMSAASRAKRNRPDLDVTVFEQSQDVSYSACGMPYNIADPLRKLDDLVVRHARIFREKQNIDLRLGHYVKSIDPKKKIVTGESADNKRFEMDYDFLLIATGASPLIPDLPGIDLPGVMCLKSLEHGRKIKEFIREKGVENAIIIGMGYIALEMAEALRTRGIEVAIVKPRPVFLPWMRKELSDVIKKELEENGVDVNLGQGVAAIEEDNGLLNVRCDNKILKGQMIIVAVGVKPNSMLALDAGLRLGPAGSIGVDRTLRTSDRYIFSAGDCSDAYHVVTGEKVWIPLALRANRAGWAVADNVTGKRTELIGVAGTSVFKVFETQAARTGLNAAEAERSGFSPAEAVIKARSRAHAHPGSTDLWVYMVGDKKTGKLLGAQLVGREGAAHRINAVAVALHAGMTVEEFSQSDLAYAPPFGPTWDPMLTAANQVLKDM
ncbi:MAG: FAD-dependent oxidoreductase [Deltaproteobacteria bacterium]|nr:FAD-dependent oxidoreductase [Deltaproteobacteria bacterium]